MLYPESTLFFSKSPSPLREIGAVSPQHVDPRCIRAIDLHDKLALKKRPLCPVCTFSETMPAGMGESATPITVKYAANQTPPTTPTLLSTARRCSSAIRHKADTDSQTLTSSTG
ncbi:hypothetical protein ALP62_101307 [Pseudomonas syringae pv. aceris]|nr:hypothetical protein ALP62_101307 [Pseudomonas syringae pv. aceris]